MNEENKQGTAVNKTSNNAVQSSKGTQQHLIYRRRRFAIIIIFSLIIFSVLGMNLVNNYRKLHALHEHEQRAQEEYVASEEQKEKLEILVAQLKDDTYVTKMARKKYLWSREGEVIYRYPGSEAEETLPSLE